METARKVGCALAFLAGLLLAIACVMKYDFFTSGDTELQIGWVVNVIVASCIILGSVWGIYNAKVGGLIIIVGAGISIFSAILQYEGWLPNMLIQYSFFTEIGLSDFGVNVIEGITVESIFACLAAVLIIGKGD